MYIPYAVNGGKAMRDLEKEVLLQHALDQGCNVWVIGDVHGFFESMEGLLGQLELEDGDWVVFLGDLIDRGPDSFGALNRVQATPNFTTVKGNHEAMMVENFTERKMSQPDMDSLLWMKNGGDTTVTSYVRHFSGGKGFAHETAMYERIRLDCKWINSLPTHLVLDRWRLVHAGYHPEQELDGQDDEQYLWIRGLFHRTKRPVDDRRTVVFGHTPTAGLPGYSTRDWGRVWRSQVQLRDGRPASIGLDTCLYHGQVGPALLTAFNLQTGETRQQQRVEA